MREETWYSRYCWRQVRLNFSLNLPRLIGYTHYSVAGLLTARACCDHFDNIIVLEPEAPLDPTVKRARVPQNKALHGQWQCAPPTHRLDTHGASIALLAIANVALEKWFPHLEETCLQDGVR